jgi:hypothetical protein
MFQPPVELAVKLPAKIHPYLATTKPSSTSSLYFEANDLAWISSLLVQSLPHLYHFHPSMLRYAHVFFYYILLFSHFL